MTGEPDADCIVVGGGIGGTVLALALAHAGQRVLILEREAALPAVARPEILAGATLAVFERLGVGRRILEEAAIPLLGLELFVAGGRRRLFHVTLQDLQAANAAPYSTDPALTRRILLEEAERTGKVKVERGVEVTGLLRQGGRVAGVQAQRSGARLTYRSALTVGDDGTHSRLRQAMGIAMPLQDFSFDFLGATVDRLPAQEEQVGEAWVDFNGVRDGLFAGLFLPIPGKRTALVFGLTAKSAAQLRREPSRFKQAAASLSPLCQQAQRLPDFPEGFSYFRRPFGHAPRYVGEGVALLGDAAHPVTPAGGQGANMSVADAVALADVAVEALQQGDCSAHRLARYEALRREANSRSLRFSARPRQIFSLLQSAPWLSPLLTLFLRCVDAQPRLKQQFLGNVARAFVSSRGE